MGGNQSSTGPTGAVEQTLRRALRDLETALGPLEVAPFYRTAAISPIPQPDFLNTAVLVRTALPPDAILAIAKALEHAAGRRLGVRLGPRPLDIDLLLYGEFGEVQIATPELILPHPRLRERRFMLEPLAALAPDLRVPPDGATVRELLARVQDQRVERLPAT
ncbi:MAG TPA: 2-amino-4-hydroxy-6-hydroxymethyldihydropteridine diphosphokinase [Thermoanaerobaculia bacterium]